MKRIYPYLFVCAMVWLMGCASTGGDSADRRMEWAKPCQITGVANCYMIEPGLYRSAQPTRQGIENLEKMGVVNPLSLRTTATDNQLASSTMMACHSVPLNYMKLNEQVVLEAVRIMNSPRNRPLLVHCRHGSDRTGLVCALYRVLVQGWSKDEAIEEMVLGEYGFHAYFTNIVSFIRNLDVEKARQQIKP
ncbi:MAG: tyrosine-protein phosphatase [Victivallales bacterium]|nr:tyrosine-protein phosphatase [Victivallales bacterium]